MSTALDLSAADRRDIAAACERLCLDYSHHADGGRPDAWAELFAADAELEVFGVVHRGRQAIFEMAAAGKDTASLHVVSNIRIDVRSASEAEGTAYVAAYVKPRDAKTAVALTPAVVGVYRDRYRRIGEGWKFARRAFEPFLVTSAS